MQTTLAIGRAGNWMHTRISCHILLMMKRAVLDRAFEDAAISLQIGPLYPEQQTAADYLLNGRDVFATLPTGSGKSVIFQVLPSLMKYARAGGDYDFPDDPVVLIVCPLNALIHDQVSALRKKGLSAAIVGETAETDSLVKKCMFSLVYSSPEALVGSDQWMDALQQQPLRDNIVAIVVDEVHTVSLWYIERT